jgi:hypothetical protein
LSEGQSFNSGKFFASPLDRFQTLEAKEFVVYYLELSDIEMNLLKNTVDYRLREIQDELTHTDNREFHAALKRDLEQLEKVGVRIGALFETTRKSIAV